MWETFTTDDGLAGWVRGEGDRLALVLHGGPGLSDYTESLADEVFAAGDGALRVARYQQRGQEPSSTEGELSLAQQVADTVAVIDVLGADHAVVVGHSWGAHLAMHVAVAAPARVSGLLLVDALGAIGDGGTATMGPTMMRRIGDEGLAAINELASLRLEPVEAANRQFALMWPGYFSDPASAPPVPPIRLAPHVNGAVMSDAMGLLGEGFLERALPGLDVPSLHLIGSHSPIDPAANERTAALMKGAIVEVVDTGHFPWLERPGCVEAAMRRLLASSS